MKHIFIINPAAGKKNDTLEIASKIKKAAVAANIEYEIVITERPKHATEIVLQMSKKYADDLVRFYACGGDGTLNEVAEGVNACENAECTHFPCGTGNDFIRSLGVEISLFYDIEKLINGKRISVDYINTSSGPFVNVASVGMDARVALGMRKYKRLFKIDGDTPYFLSILENLLKPMGRKMQISIDGENFDGNYIFVVVSNGKYYGGGFCTVPESKIDDGILDVLLVKAMSRFAVPSVLPKYKKGQYKTMPKYITYKRCKKINIRPADKYFLDVNLDGEVEKASELEILIGQEKIVFVVPENNND